MNISNISGKEISFSYDELSLWAAPFGLKLLEKIDLKENLNILDLGCGTGFPAIEIAERLGITSKVYGIDNWGEALVRARYKAKVYGLRNVKFILGNALSMPFSKNSFDFIFSNNGINNTGEEEKTIKECNRICKRDGFLVFTVNLPDTMIEFYDILRKFLISNRLYGVLDKMYLHIKKHRKSIEEYENYINNANFSIEEIDKLEFKMEFLDGSSMLNHHFIKFWFLKSWTELFENFESLEMLKRVEENLNSYAKEKGHFILTIPFACFKCKKIDT